MAKKAGNKTGFEKEVFDLGQEIANNFGMDNLTGKIFLMLYLEPEAVALEEIAKETGYSLSTVSAKMKIIEQHGMIQRVRKPGSKKAFFFMEKDLGKIVAMKLEGAIQAEIIPVKKHLPGILKKYKEKVASSKDETLKKKYNIMKKYYSQMKKFDIIMNKLLKEVQDL